MRKLLFITMLISAANSAFALDEIYSPNVEYRELSLEYNGSRTFDRNSEKNNAQDHELAIEAGLTPRWTLSLSGGFSKEPDASLKMSEAEIENRFQFFEAGENWLDSGLLVAYGYSPLKQTSDHTEVKLLLQKDVGKITNTTNIGFTQSIGKYSAGGPDYVFLWNTRYRYNDNFQPGIEIQSDLGQDGTINHFNQQEHYVGPAVYGKLLGSMKYQAAWLFGANNNSAQSSARLLLEYETHF